MPIRFYQWKTLTWYWMAGREESLCIPLLWDQAAAVLGNCGFQNYFGGLSSISNVEGFKAPEASSRAWALIFLFSNRIEVPTSEMVTLSQQHLWVLRNASSSCSFGIQGGSYCLYLLSVISFSPFCSFLSCKFLFSTSYWTIPWVSWRHLKSNM